MDFLLLAQSKASAVGHDKGEDHLFIKRENTIGWSDADAPYIIAGIGIFHPRVLVGAPDGKFSVKILWHQALAQNRLFCLPHHGRWFQTGTIAGHQKSRGTIGGRSKRIVAACRQTAAFYATGIMRLSSESRYVG